MLVLTRKEGESLYVGDDIRITIISTDCDRVRIGIEAPPSLRIFREELLISTKEQNLMAVQSAYSESPVAALLKEKSEKTEGK